MNLSDEIRSTITGLPKNIDEVEHKPVHEILLLMGGGMAMIFSPIFLIFHLVTMGGKSGIFPVAQAFGTFIICMVFGFGLLYTYANIKQRPRTSFIVGCVCSIVLFAGGYAGWIGGILGIAGLLLFFAKKSDML